MDNQRIIKIVEVLDELSNKFSTDEVLIASYIAIRYGTYTCKYYIDDTDLDKINKEISKCGSLFDETLNYRIDKILNNNDKTNVKCIK